MDYNWDGDVIVQDSVVDKKRYVIGYIRPITTDIREFVSPADDAVIKGVLKELSEKKGLPTSKKPGDFDRRASIIWDHVARSVTYRHDAKKQRKGDFWLFPSEVLTMGFGDCEDGSFLLASLLIGSGISPFNVRVALGELYDRSDNSLGGHCWPMYKNEAGRWCILESTFDRAPWGLPTTDRFTGREEIRYVPHFCFNNHHLWTVRHEGRPRVNVQRYLKRRDTPVDLVNLKDTKFPSGGWLSVLAGDNSPGHLELTGDALRNMGFPEDAVSVASDAAQDPDLFEWFNPAAHAQTDCDPATGATNQSDTEAISAFLTWFDTYRTRLLSAGFEMHALFYLGYLLHGVQDLASHQGLTNAQHAYESYLLCKNGNDCDHLEANRQVARHYSATLLERLETKSPSLFKRMRKYDAGFTLFEAKVPREEKSGLLAKPHGWDFSVTAFMGYKGLVKKYGKVKDANPVIRWNRAEVFKQLLTTV